MATNWIFKVSGFLSLFLLGVGGWGWVRGYMLECEQTQEVLCCHLKGKGLIRKSPQVCTADWMVGGSFLLLLILVGWSVLLLFRCLFFGGGVFSNQWQIPSNDLLVLKFKNVAYKWRISMLGDKACQWNCIGKQVTIILVSWRGCNRILPLLSLKLFFLCCHHWLWLWIAHCFSWGAYQV